MIEVTVRDGQDRVTQEDGPSEVQNIAFFHQVRLALVPYPPSALLLQGLKRAELCKDLSNSAQFSSEIITSNEKFTIPASSRGLIQNHV